jgi:hypothetical protein
MTNALVFIEACTVCNRVQRTYLGRRSRRKTPLVCADCAEETKKGKTSPKPAQASQGRRG